uniref:Uncharacterized protein n=1 Tax=Romanomermis culicivorax TaxID=13658 RepID=A0A915L8A2_ROMCU
LIPDEEPFQNDNPLINGGAQSNEKDTDILKTPTIDRRNRDFQFLSPLFSQNLEQLNKLVQNDSQGKKSDILDPDDEPKVQSVQVDKDVIELESEE